MVLGSGIDGVVANARDVAARGLYNPHTVHGDIVVNDVVTTSYTDAVPVPFAQAVLWVVCCVVVCVRSQLTDFATGVLTIAVSSARCVLLAEAHSSPTWYLGQCVIWVRDVA